MKNLKFKQTPSKFSKGIPLLWNGNSFANINKFIFSFLKFDKRISSNQSCFLFESARSAIYNSLAANDIGKGDEVIISSFTCDAVTSAVVRSGATVVYVDINNDLSMNCGDLIDAISPSTKAVIMQNTFGRVGIDIETLEIIRKKDILIIEDCALAIGSKVNDVDFGLFGDISIWSLETSKTFTIGWGGVVKVNNKDCLKKISDRYETLGAVSFFQDFRRFFQLWFSLLMMKIKISGGVVIWYLMYGLRVFRRSADSVNIETKSLDGEKLGVISSSLFFYQQSLISNVFNKTNQNYKILQNKAIELDLKCPIIERENEFIVSPRFSILVDQKQIGLILKIGKEIKVEVGRWFDQSPPSKYLLRSKVFSCANSKNISERIINIPCHWTLTENDMEKLTMFLTLISKIK
jgi:perosamine synthetase